MLTWVKRDVASPYGPVSTLHWAVAPSSSTTTDGEGRDDLHKTRVEEVDMSTAEQVELESAEDQLGAVLWNSNSAALSYLHNHVFADHPALRTRLVARSANAKEAAPLRGLRVVELGAGVGCLGIALAMAGARSAITDLKELLPLMAYNVKLNADRVHQHSHGLGDCAAMAWKWGPSTATNPKKQLRKYAQEAAANKTRTGDAEIAVATSMVRALMAPSEPWRACASFLSRPSSSSPATAAADVPMAKVDYVIMCDALYGNPQAWPQLLYTLTEILAANPDGCEVVNFCEQRVEDVEGAFLTMLDDENARTLRWWREGVHVDADRTGASHLAAEQPASVKRGRDDVASGAATGTAGSALTLSSALSRALLESPTAMLELAMWEKQCRLPSCHDGKSAPYIWHYKREKVTESASDLQMSILVTRIRWVRAPVTATDAVDSRHASPACKKQRRE